jgi:dihydropteroate synthase
VDPATVATQPATLRLRERTLSWTRPLLMGVVNANPDSFSDPGRRRRPDVVERAIGLVDAGATLIDVGAQSAITGRPPVDAVAEATAVAPTVAEIVSACPEAVVSVDPFKPAVAEAALEAGAQLFNDVSGLRDRAIARLCGAYGAGLVVMHTTAPPLTRLQRGDRYVNVAAEVGRFLRRQVEVALVQGVSPGAVVVDPGIDFTKTPGQTVELLRGINHVVALGYPVLLAVSRKDFVGAVTDRQPSHRGAGTLGAVAALRHVPRQILRVHDVAAVRDFLLVLDVLTGELGVEPGLTLPEHLRHEPVAGA